MNENNDETVDTQQNKEPFGKFATAEELLFAYNALQSEFTKRCQLLKQLQAELNDLRAQVNHGASGDDGDGDGEPSASTICAGEREIDGADEASPQSGLAADELSIPEEIVKNMQEYAEILSAVPEVMNACIARYKKKLLDTRDGFRSIGGAAVIVPADRPKTLSEAKALADLLLK